MAFVSLKCLNVSLGDFDIVNLYLFLQLVVCIVYSKVKKKKSKFGWLDAPSLTLLVA